VGKGFRLVSRRSRKANGAEGGRTPAGAGMFVMICQQKDGTLGVHQSGGSPWVDRRPNESQESGNPVIIYSYSIIINNHFRFLPSRVSKYPFSDTTSTSIDQSRGSWQKVPCLALGFLASICLPKPTYHHQAESPREYQHTNLLLCRLKQKTDRFYSCQGQLFDNHAVNRARPRTSEHAEPGSYPSSLSLSHSLSPFALPNTPSPHQPALVIRIARVQRHLPPKADSLSRRI